MGPELESCRVGKLSYEKERIVNNMAHEPGSRRAFTLVELLIVMAITTILLALVAFPLVQYRAAAGKGHR